MANSRHPHGVAIEPAAMSESPRQVLTRARRVVVKVGTAVVTGPEGRLALGRLGALVEQLHLLRGQGREVLLVSSGAVGLGASKLGMSAPTALVDRQACAAAGQGALIALYENLFRQLGEVGAQVLLTEEDFLHRHRYLKLHDTLERLLELGAVPVINENDTVSTAEIALGKDKVFGDNDRLSALVAAGVDADLLVLLTNVDGVYSAPPGTPEARRIDTWTAETEVRFGAGSAGGRGGMQAKIAAAEVAVRAGTSAVVASGMDPTALLRIVQGEEVGTLFPARVPWNRRRRWLAYATQPVGRLVVNAGARAAMVERNASLLAAGVEAVEGAFDAGAVVSVVGPDGREFARGICARSSGEALGDSGGRSRALVHRDNIVILSVEDE